MKIKLLLHKPLKEPEIHICFAEYNDEIEQLRKTVEQAVNFTITGYTENGVELLPADSIIRIYTEGQNVYAATEQGEYRLHQRLYELEAMLQEHRFIRISNSEMVNIHKIIKLDTSMTGTIRIYLKGNMESYVSRRNVSKLKKALGI